MESKLEEYLKDYEILKTEIVENDDSPKGVAAIFCSSGAKKVVKIIVVLPKNKLKQIETAKKAKRNYYENHKDEVNAKMAEWRKDKYKNDPEFKQRALEATRRCKAKKKEKEDIEKIE